jgi:hypothetical protein
MFYYILRPLKNLKIFLKLQIILVTKRLSFFFIAGSSLHVIAKLFLPVIAGLFLPVIANRRVGKCTGVKQSPRCTFLLVLSVLGRLLRLIVIRLAMTQWGCSLAKAPLSVIARSKATKQSTPTLQFIIAILLFYTKKEKVIIQKQNIANFLAKVLNFVI